MVLITKLLTLALTAAATPIFRRDAVTVQDDINQNIAPAITTLGNDVAAFPANGLTGTVAIHTDFENLISVVNSATADINISESFDEDSGTTIISDVQAGTEYLEGILDAVKDQESTWSDFPGGTNLVLGDLQALNTAFDDFLDALTRKDPSSSGQIDFIKDSLDSHFSAAIDAYSS